jgi:zinc protease
MHDVLQEFRFHSNKTMEPAQIPKPSNTPPCLEPGERVSTKDGIGVIKAVLGERQYSIKLLNNKVDEVVTFGHDEVSRVEVEDSTVKIPIVRDVKPNTKIPINPAILKGKFASGMSYFVLGNKEPPNRAELTVAIKTGSIHEREEEKGIAHMLEHLTFRASVSKDNKKRGNNSPPTSSSSTPSEEEKKSLQTDAPAGTPRPPVADINEDFYLIKRLEEHGIQFGAHQNAYTSFDETVYFIHVPMEVKGTTSDENTNNNINDSSSTASTSSTSSSVGESSTATGNSDKRLAKDSILAQCMEIISSLVLSARVTDEDVQAERSIVIEEWRSSQGAMQRWSDKYFEELLSGSRYANRLPIGDLDAIRNVSGETMRNFYSKRYQMRFSCVCVCVFFTS